MELFPRVDKKALREAIDQVYHQINLFLQVLINEERWDEVEDLWDCYLDYDPHSPISIEGLECIAKVFTEKHITDAIIDHCPKDRVLIHELMVEQGHLNHFMEPKALARLLEKVPDVIFMREKYGRVNLFGLIFFNNHDLLKVVCVALVRQWRALDEVKCLLVDHYGMSNKCYYDLVSSFIENPLLHRHEYYRRSVLHDLVRDTYCYIQKNHSTSESLLKFLLKWAPNKDELIEATDSNGKTPYDIAQEDGGNCVDEHILKLLLPKSRIRHTSDM